MLVFSRNSLSNSHCDHFCLLHFSSVSFIFLWQVDNTAVGFMSISTELDLNLLNDCFELEPFHGLHKPNAVDVTTPPRMISPLPDEGQGKWRWHTLLAVYTA